MKILLPLFQQTKEFCSWILILGFTGFIPVIIQAQTANGLKITSTSTVTCEKSEKGAPHSFSLETVSPGDCEKVCINSTIEYQVINGTTSGYLWTVSGGRIVSQTGNGCYVQWDHTALGQLTVYGATLVNGQWVQNGSPATICVEKVPTPELEIMQGIHFLTHGVLYVCVNEEIFLQGLETSGMADVTYWNWNFGDGASSSDQNPVYQWTNEGSYEVTLTAKTACNCIAEVTLKVIVKPEKFFTIDCPSVVCEGAVQKYSTNADCSPYNWIAQGGTILNQQDNEVEVEWNQVGDEGFGVLMLDNASCQNSQCAPFTTVEIPVIKANGKIQGKEVACVGEEVRYSMPKWPATIFHWTLDKSPGGDAFSHVLDAGIDNEREIPVIFTKAGKILLEVEYTNTLLDCKGRATLLINIDEKPQISGNDKVCQNQTEPYTFTHYGNVQSTDWEIQRPNGTVDQVNSQSTINYTFTDAGVYFIQAASQATCPPDPFKVVVSAAPQSPVIYGDPVVCLNNNARYYTDNLPGYRYRWEAVNGTIANPNTDDISVKWTTLNNATQLKAYYIDREAPNCESAPTVWNIRSLANANITVARQGSGDIYENCTSVYVCSYDKADDYQWSILPSYAGSVIKNAKGDKITVQWHEISLNTNFQISVTLKKCETQTRTITLPMEILRDIPDMLVTAFPTSTCPGNPVNFTTNYPSNTSTQWYVDGSHVATGSSFSYDFSGDASARETLVRRITASALLYCSVKREHSVLVTVQPNPLMSISPNSNISFCEGMPVPSTWLTVNSGGALPPGVNYKWYKNGSLVQDMPDATYYATEAGTYYATAKDANGCILNSHSISIYSKSCISGGTQGTIIPWPIASIDYCERIITMQNPVPGNPALSWQSSRASRIDPPTNNLVRFKITGAGMVEITARITVSDFTTLYESSRFVAYLPDIEIRYHCDPSGFQYTFIDNSLVAPGYETATPQWILDNTPLSGNTHLFLYSDNNSTHTITLDFGQDYSCTRSFSVKKDADARYTISPNQPYCEETPLLFTPTTLTPNIQTYSWTLDINNTRSTLQSTEKTYTYDKQHPYPIANTHNNYLIVTDIMGCTDYFQENPIQIAWNNFEGKVLPTPSSEVCLGTPVVLSYKENQGSDLPNFYLWQHNGSSLPTTTATQPGDYYVTVGNTNTGCYKMSAPGTPAIIKTGPIIISGKTTLCQGENGLLSANTGNADATYKWFKNNQQVATTPDLAISAWAVGIYPVRVEVSTPIGNGNRCTETATTTVKIVDMPQQPKIDFSLLSCDPYRIGINVTNPQPAGTYQWSTGNTGTHVDVPQGGPYRVRYTSPEGCQSESDVLTVPYSPDYYFWTFPKGCYNLCSKVQYAVHGPAGFPDNQNWMWDWITDGYVQSSGSWPGYDRDGLSPFMEVDKRASLFQMNLTSALCNKMTGPFSVQWEECDGCKVDINVLNVVCIHLDNGQEAYQMDMDFHNHYPFPLYYTFTPGSGSLVVQGGILHQGSNQRTVTFIPPAGFTSGIIMFNMGANNAITGLYCESKIEYSFKQCADYGYVKTNASASNENSQEQLLLPNSGGNSRLLVYPNPANTQVTITYALPAENPTPAIEIYDMQGKQKGSWILPKSEGALQFTVGDWVQGIYIVKLVSGGKIVETQKMVIVK